MGSGLSVGGILPHKLQQLSVLPTRTSQRKFVDGGKAYNNLCQLKMKIFRQK